MKYHPMDPEYDTFGSLELTHVVIEEVGEVQEKGVRVLNTRKNRFLNKEYGIVGKSVYTCNPTQNFIKRMFYEVYKALGMGRYQKWEHGQVELADGTNGDRLPSLREVARLRQPVRLAQLHRDAEPTPLRPSANASGMATGTSTRAITCCSRALLLRSRPPGDT